MIISFVVNYNKNYNNKRETGFVSMYNIVFLSTNFYSLLTALVVKIHQQKESNKQIIIKQKNSNIWGKKTVDCKIQ